MYGNMENYTYLNVDVFQLNMLRVSYYFCRWNRGVRQSQGVTQR